MHKEKFDTWNKVKKVLNTCSSNSKFFYERDIWFAHLGKNIGDEQDGKGNDFLRPILILKKFNKNLFWAMPTTSQEKNGRFYFSIKEIKNKKNTLILSQIRLLDSKRLKYKLGKLPNNEFLKVKEKLIELINESH